jgi:hypothetical protein
MLGKNTAVEIHAHGKELPSFQWIAADAALAKEANLVEPSLVITTTIQLAGAVDERLYRATALAQEELERTRTHGCFEDYDASTCPNSK